MKKDAELQSILDEKKRLQAKLQSFSHKIFGQTNDEELYLAISRCSQKEANYYAMQNNYDQAFQCSYDSVLQLHHQRIHVNELTPMCERLFAYAKLTKNPVQMLACADLLIKVYEGQSSRIAIRWILKAYVIKADYDYQQGQFKQALLHCRAYSSLFHQYTFERIFDFKQRHDFQSILEIMIELKAWPSANALFQLAVSHFKKSRFLSQSRTELILGYLLFLAMQNEIDEALLDFVEHANRYRCQQQEVDINVKELNQPAKAFVKKVLMLYMGLGLQPPTWFHVPYLTRASHAHQDTVETVELKPIEPVDVHPMDIEEEPDILSRLTADWSDLGIGGYQHLIHSIMQQVFLPRALPKEVIAKIGVPIPKGALFEGPPGTGKTLMARKIALHFFDAAYVQVINGPELLNKYVGESERRLRLIFERARRDPKHTYVYIFDEIDALCKKRTSETSVGDKVSNNLTTTLLTILDGVESLNNVLIIGTTNFKSLMDEALLRPGRLGLNFTFHRPDIHERAEILALQIQTGQSSGLIAEDVDVEYLAEHTPGLTGAELMQLVSLATSRVYPGYFHFGKDHRITLREDIEDNPPQVVHLDFVHALESFNNTRAEHALAKPNQPLCLYNNQLKDFYTQVVNKFTTWPKSYFFSIGIFGADGTGKTHLSLGLAQTSSFQPQIRYITPEVLLGKTMAEKISVINTLIQEVLQDDFGVLVIDDIEQILNASPKGLHYDNAMRIFLRQKLTHFDSQGEQKHLAIIYTCKDKSLALEWFGNRSYQLGIELDDIKTQEEVHQLCEALGLKRPIKGVFLEPKLPMPIYLLIQNLKEQAFYQSVAAQSELASIAPNLMLFAQPKNEKEDSSTSWSSEMNPLSLPKKSENIRSS